MSSSSGGRGGVPTTGVGRDLAVFVILGALLAGYAFTRVEGTLAGYRIGALHAEEAELLREQQALKIELATRRAAGRIEQDARTRLGMVEPAPDAILPVARAAHAAIVVAKPTQVAISETPR